MVTALHTTTHKQFVVHPACLKWDGSITGLFMRKLLAIFALTFTVSFVPATFASAAYGLEETAGAAELPTSKSITVILGDVIGNALSLVSVLFFALMLYAGIKWMLARGDSGQAEQALDTIVAAIIGLIVVLASYAITNFVFKSVNAGQNNTGPDTSTPTAKKVWCITAQPNGVCTERTEKCNSTDQDLGPYESKEQCKLFE